MSTDAPFHALLELATTKTRADTEAVIRVLVAMLQHEYMRTQKDFVQALRIALSAARARHDIPPLP